MTSSAASASLPSQSDSTAVALSDPPRWFAAFVGWTVLAFTVALAVFAWRFSFFIPEDLMHLEAARRTPLGPYLLRFVDVHFVPLHRMVNWILARATNLNFGLVLAAEAAIHLLTVRALLRLLRDLCPGPAPWWLAVLYASGIYLVVVLVWWTSALHRLPCLFFTVVSLQQSVQWADRGRLRHLVVSVLAMIAALGFYPKGALIPLYAGGIELCRLVASPRIRSVVLPMRRIVRTTILLAAMAAPIAGYGWYVAGHVEQRVGRVDFLGPATFTVAVRMLRIASQAPFLLYFDPARLRVNCFVDGVIVLLFVASTLRSWRSFLPWIVGAGWLAASVLAIAVSNRGLSFGIGAATIHRYYFETMLPLVLTGALVVRQFSIPIRKRRGWPYAPGAVFLGIFVGIAFQQSAGFAHKVLAFHEASRGKLRTAIEDARRMAAQGRPFSVFDDVLSSEGGWFWGGVRYRTLFELAGLSLSYNRLDLPLFRVRPDGALASVELDHRADLLALPPVRRAEVEVQSDRSVCQLPSASSWNPIELSLPAEVDLRSVALIFEFQTPETISADVFYRNSTGTFTENTRSRIEFDSSWGSAFLPVRPIGPSEEVHLRSVRIDFAAPQRRICFRHVWLVSLRAPG